jgi:SAM-dependent methyltransferase
MCAVADAMRDDIFEGLLVCPREKLPLRSRADCLFCENDHRYAVIEGIPILLLSETEQTHIEGSRALALAEGREPINLPQFKIADDEVDPFVKNAIAATNGSLYLHLVGNLTEYPIPELRLPLGKNKLFLEIGCNWGRWCIAAARLGYRPIGVDPSLKSIRAARRVARQLGIDAYYVVADGRYLPFAKGTFDQVFSYSVLQHLSKENARTALHEVRRVLASDGQSLIQMPNAFGIRCLYHQVRRNFREARDFEVRYWTPTELNSFFNAAIGPSRVMVDGYFSLNAQISDARFMPPRYRALLRASEFLRSLSRIVPALTWMADSLYVTSSL